tara:strand:+ start:242 stop:352 length:111 start_codon:yes stop_codon:yes gene_type:complete
MENLFVFEFVLKKTGRTNIKTNNKKIVGTIWSKPII